MYAIKITIYRNFEPRNTGDANEERQEKAYRHSW